MLRNIPRVARRTFGAKKAAAVKEAKLAKGEVLESSSGFIKPELKTVQEVDKN